MKLICLPKAERSRVNDRLCTILGYGYRTTDAIEKLRNEINFKYGDAPELEALHRASENLDCLIAEYAALLEDNT